MSKIKLPKKGTLLKAAATVLGLGSLLIGMVKDEHDIDEAVERRLLMLKEAENDNEPEDLDDDSEEPD